MIRRFSSQLNTVTSLWGYAPDKLTRLLRYSVPGTFTFAIDFACLWLFTDIFGIEYLLSGGLAFTIGTSLNYFLTRNWAFRGSVRKLGSGYVYFLTICAIGLILTVSLLALFVESLKYHYLTARLLSAVFVGLWNFFMNAYFNFRIFK